MSALVIERTFHIADVGGRRGGCRRSIREGRESMEPLQAAGRIPRVARLMALAIRCEQLLRSGAVPDASALAKLARVSQPRMTQILNLALMAPDIQEKVLFLQPHMEGNPEISEKSLRQICADTNWGRQRSGFETWARRSQRLAGGDGPIPSCPRTRTDAQHG